MKVLNSFILILIILLITGCDNKNSSKKINYSEEEILSILDNFINYRNDLDEEISELVSRPEVVESFKDNNFETLNFIYPFNNFSIYDIQGYSVNSDQNIRDTISYKRIMGHLDYFNILSIEESEAYYFILIKVYDETRTQFLGLINFEIPLNDFLEQFNDISGIYIMDSNKLPINISNKSILEIPINDLEIIVKKLNAIEENKGSFFDGNETLNYFTKEGLALIY